MICFRGGACGQIPCHVSIKLDCSVIDNIDLNSISLPELQCVLACISQLMKIFCSVFFSFDSEHVGIKQYHW